MFEQMNEERNMSLDERLRKGGYGADFEIPADYRERVTSDPEWRKDIDKMLSLVPKEIELQSGKIDLKDAIVLDIGSGPGILAERIKDKVDKVIAVDREENMTRDVNERLTEDGKVEVVRGDFLEVPLADDSVDLVLSGGTIWHIPIEKIGKDNEVLTPTQIEDMFLSESLRVLKPGGVYILDGVWNGDDSSVARDFIQEREKEIVYYKKKQAEKEKETPPLIHRNFVISTSGLEERLRSLGYICKIELPDTRGRKNVAIKINLLEKIKTK